MNSRFPDQNDVIGFTKQLLEKCGFKNVAVEIMTVPAALRPFLPDDIRSRIDEMAYLRVTTDVGTFGILPVRSTAYLIDLTELGLTRADVLGEPCDNSDSVLILQKSFRGLALLYVILAARKNAG